MEGTRESHPRVHDLQHPRLGKPRRGLQIMDTRMGFPCPFHSVVIDSINLRDTHNDIFVYVCTCVQLTLDPFKTYIICQSSSR